MLLDAGPLIYLAKLDALDVFEHADHTPMVTPEVERETARPGLAYVYPDAITIAGALDSGLLQRTTLSTTEQAAAAKLMEEAGGLDLGEAEVLAAGLARSLPVLLFERRATRLARSLGLDTRSPLSVLATGTPDLGLLRERIAGFARLVDMHIGDLERLLEVIEGERR